MGWRKRENPTDKLIRFVELKLRYTPPARILDMGGRDGWIGHELKKFFPDAEVICADIDPEEFGKYEDVTYIESDMFENVTGKFDLIIADTNSLTNEQWVNIGEPEPKIAFTDGGDGSSMMMAIAEAIPEYLNKPGMVALEVGDLAGRLPDWRVVEKVFLVYRIK